MISRCQRLELSPLAGAEVEAALINRWDIDSQKAELLAKLSHGRLAAFDDSLLQQRSEKIQRLLDIIDADYEERFTYAAELAAQFSRRRGSVQLVLDLWLDFWRDLLLVKVGCSETITAVDLEATLVEMA
ncbi:hypothetical protein ACFLVO_04645, partial [Chloroflexota bacterium]